MDRNEEAWTDTTAPVINHWLESREVFYNYLTLCSAVLSISKHWAKSFIIFFEIYIDRTARPTFQMFFCFFFLNDELHKQQSFLVSDEGSASRPESKQVSTAAAVYTPPWNTQLPKGHTSNSGGMKNDTVHNTKRAPDRRKTNQRGRTCSFQRETGPTKVSEKAWTVPLIRASLKVFANGWF